MAGAAIQSSTNGIITHHASRPAQPTSRTARTAIRTLAHMWRYTPNRPSRTPSCACAAVTHSSRSRRDTIRRYKVRPIASVMSQAWWARNVMTKVICSTASPKSSASARRWLCATMPDRRGAISANTGSNVGKAIVASTNRVQLSAAGSGSSQPANSAMTMAGAESVRRRLSSIFQRPSSGSDLRPRRVASPRPKIHGSNCQSPRAQRWLRAAATS